MAKGTARTSRSASSQRAVHKGRREQGIRDQWQSRYFWIRRDAGDGGRCVRWPRSMLFVLLGDGGARLHHHRGADPGAAAAAHGAGASRAGRPDRRRRPARGRARGVRPALAAALSQAWRHRAAGGQRLLRLLGRGQPRLARRPCQRARLGDPGGCLRDRAGPPFRGAGPIRSSTRSSPARSGGRWSCPWSRMRRDGDFDGAGMAALLHDPRARSGELLDQVERCWRGGRRRHLRFRGAAAAAQPDYLRFIAEAKRRFAPHAEGDDGGAGRRSRLELEGLCRTSPTVLPDGYDEHCSGEPGPIASQAWFVSGCARRCAGRRRTRRSSRSATTPMTGPTGSRRRASDEEAWLAAHDSGADRASIRQRQRHLRLQGRRRHAHQSGCSTRPAPGTSCAPPKPTAWRRRAVAAGLRRPGVWARFRRLQPRQPPDLSTLRRSAMSMSRAMAKSCASTATPTAGAAHRHRDRRGLIRGEHYPRLADALRRQAHRLPARPGRADLRRRPGPRLDAADPRHPEARRTSRPPSS